MNYNIKKYFPFVLFVGAMLILHAIMGFNGDDIKYAKVLTNQSLVDYINYRYYNWSSRLIIDGLLVILTHIDMIIWKILDVIIYTFGVYYIIKLVNKKYSKKMAYFGILLFLMYPFYEMASAGWISTTLNYSWCFAFGIISFIPLIYEVQGEKVNRYMYVISFLALLFATNQEQSGALIFAFNLLYLLNSLINKKPVNKFNVLATVISAGALIFVFTCPGNTIRFAHEVAYWYPEFANFTILDKSYLGLVTTFGSLIEQKILFPMFYIILSVFVLIRSENKYLKYFCYFNIILVVFITVFNTFIDISILETSLKSLGNVPGVIKNSPLMAIPHMFEQIVNATPYLTETLKLFTYEGLPKLSINSISIVVLCLYLLISSCIMLVKAFPKNLLPFFIFLGGFVSRFIVGFSPVVFPSGARVTIFLYVALITLILMLLKKLYDNNAIPSRTQVILENSFLIIAFLNYVIVFAISFMKYGIF
ncbi:DUF6056 family protein [Methanobrevibacter sp.]|uniref:DUF6056 family protein n=1 Tax=Methanobrevibacter sp. TaxID=66852 RepID=UPI003976C5C7